MTDQLAADEHEDVPSADASDPTPAPATDATPDADPPRRGRRERISKWDRPPEPHDWRFFVGNLGKVLIATGVLMFGFVAYQLWGTGIETARAQNKLENQFEELLAEFGADPVPAEPADDSSGAAPDGDDTTAVVADDQPTEPGDASAVEDAGADAPLQPGDVVAPDSEDAAVPVAVDLSDEAVEQDIPPIIRGDVLARLEIPSIDRVDYVVPGVDLNDLKSGPGHYPDTPLPGQLGNAAIAGHRTTYSGPFFDVDQLRPSDEIIVTMANGDRFVYEVTGVEIVAASDYWVVTTSNPDIAELTLTSCHPKYTARDRIVVHSVLNPAKSSNVGVATFYELEPDPDDGPIPGDDPVLEADEPAGDEVVDGPVDDGAADEAADDVSGEVADGAVDEVTDDVAGGVVDEVADEVVDEVVDEAEPTSVEGAARLTDAPTGQPDDAFSQGWFHDMSAFPQIALWGTALTIISLAAYAISRRFRHDSIGFLAGIVPFLVALYFFFQNVNRLLPPGL